MCTGDVFPGSCCPSRNLPMLPAFPAFLFSLPHSNPVFLCRRWRNPVVWRKSCWYKANLFQFNKTQAVLGSTIWTSRIQSCFQLVHASPVLTCKQNSTYAQFPQPITVVSYSIPAEWIRMPEWPTSEARLEDTWYLFCNQMLLIDLGHEGIKIPKCIVRCSTISGQLISRNKTVSILPQKECASWWI